MAAPNQTPPNTASDYATTQFIVQQLMNGMATAAAVRVMSCTNDGGVTPVGRVSVNLLVDMVTGDGTTIPHGTIFNAPYTRLQGGANAVILDPQPGDLGVCVFCSRDISSVKADPAAARDRTPSPGASPGSKRVFSLSDAVYVGGMLNGDPTQYVQFSEDGITVTSPSTVTIVAPTITLDGDVHITGETTGDQDGVFNGISVHDHPHSGVTAGGDESGPPVP